MPFLDAILRHEHFKKHGAVFGALNEIEYERLADAFLRGPKGSTVLEYIRSQGDCVRFDPVTNEFGVIDSTGVVRTYFIPVAGVSHPFATNMDCFR